MFNANLETYNENIYSIHTHIQHQVNFDLACCKLPTWLLEDRVDPVCLHPSATYAHFVIK